MKKFLTKFRNKRKNFFKKFKNFNKKVQTRLQNHFKSHLVGILLTLGVLSTFAVFAVFSPLIHKQYLYNKVGKVVVKTLINSRSGGTGFYVEAPSGKSYILTNEHICRESKDGLVFIKHESGDSPERFVPRKILEMSADIDLCLVEGYGNNSGLSLASSIDEGDSLFVVGHPALQSLTVSSGSLMNKAELVEILYKIHVTKEECESFGKNFEYFEILDPLAAFFYGFRTGCMKRTLSYQSDAFIRPGNSGSPVVNIFGNLIAVAFAGDRYGFSYFVPLEDVKRFLQVY